MKKFQRESAVSTCREKNHQNRGETQTDTELLKMHRGMIEPQWLGSKLNNKGSGLISIKFSFMHRSVVQCVKVPSVQARRCLRWSLAFDIKPNNVSTPSACGKCDRGSTFGLPLKSVLKNRGKRTSKSQAARVKSMSQKV